MTGRLGAILDDLDTLVDEVEWTHRELTKRIPELYERMETLREELQLELFQEARNEEKANESKRIKAILQKRRPGEQEEHPRPADERGLAPLAGPFD